ncbi:MAG: rRNA maturation RNase YbeY [Patescibacteria group bacterium]
MPILLETPTLSVMYTTKKVPLLNGAFLRTVKKTILQDSYDLTVICVGKDKMKSINTEYRKIKKPTDILSFPLDTETGEIYLCFEKIFQKAKLFEMKPEDYIKYLLVHGMVHLLGHDHGDEMDRLEKIYTKKLHIQYPYRYTK